MAYNGVMPFVFLLVFALISFQTVWPGPPAEILSEPDWLSGYIYVSLLAPCAIVLGFWAISIWRVHRFDRQLARYPEEHGKLWRRFHRDNRRQILLLTACYLGVLFGLGWGFAAEACAKAWGVAWMTQFILFGPFLLALVLCWASFYRAERASHALAGDVDSFVGPWGYLLFQIRHNLLLVVPPIVLSLALQSFFLIFPGMEKHELVLGVAGLLLLVAAIISVPLILRVFLGLRKMPAGPLRERLEATARRLGLGFSDILVWNTRHSIANAMVSGAVPWLRYIVLTDLLIDRLTPEEIEAVFGHEVGHIKHHHMMLYILFFIGSLALMTGLWKLCETSLQIDAVAGAAEQVVQQAQWLATADVAAGPVLLGLVSVYVFVVFGYLSRRCERQADLYGCRAVSCWAFVSALEKVADLNGIPRHRHNWLASWQHPSIAQRVEFVMRVHEDPALEPPFHRSLWRLKLGLMSALSVGLLLVGWALGPEQVLALLSVR